MRSTLLLLPLLPLAACDPDTDLDGLTDAEEAELGTDPLELDTDGDGLPDGYEVWIHGTDPLMADTDLDGFNDQQELQRPSDPLDWMSYPHGPDITQWVDNSGRFEPSAQPGGWSIGQQIPLEAFVDQYGEPMDLHQLWGHVVLVDLSVGWCGPSRRVAETSEDAYRDLVDDGFLYVHLMSDDNESGDGVTDPNFLSRYAEEYGITHPVVTFDPHAERVPREQSIWLSDGNEGGIPFLVLLDPTLTVVDAGNGSGSEKPLLAKAAEMLGR